MPVLEIIALLVLAFIIGGVAGRIRGSGLVSNTVARFGVWGGTIALFVLVATQSPIYALAGLILAGIGASFGYWGDFDLTLPQNCTFENFAKLSVMGMIRLFPLFVASFFVGLQWHVLPGVLAGLMFYPAYYAGTKIAPKVNLPLLTVPSEWGEFLFWGSLLAALAAGFLI